MLAQCEPSRKGFVSCVSGIGARMHAVRQVVGAETLYMLSGEGGSQRARRVVVGPRVKPRVQATSMHTTRE